MSCIRFSTDAQREQFRASAPVMLAPEEAARRHPVPAMTEGKVRRLRLLAEAQDPKIRESVASNRHTPGDVLARLVLDADEGVRGCVARNEAASPDLLRTLAADTSERVRGWSIVSAACPADILLAAEEDPSEVVRGLLAWRSQNAAPQGIPAASPL